jgi:hydrogenase nickel incorporation protein HypA/HybF
MRLIDRPEDLFFSCKLRSRPGRDCRGARSLSIYEPFPMRELQAAQSILEQALHRVRAAHATRVRGLRLAMGEIGELDQETIRQHWDELSRGTPAERATLEFRSVQAELQCMACFEKYHPRYGKIHCPHCGSYGAKILAGEEFHIDSIELEP